MRYNEQVLSTDIAYNFGDNKNGGIQFPLISFCPNDFVTNASMVKKISAWVRVGGIVLELLKTFHHKMQKFYPFEKNW